MKRLSRIAAIVLVGALAIGLAGCSNKDVAAKVNGKKIPMSEITQQMTAIKAQYPQMFTGPDAKAREADLNKRILENLIDTELVTQAAEDKGIKVTDAEIAKQMDQLKKGLGTDKAFQDALKKAGTTEAKLKEQIRKQLLIQKLTAELTKNIKVTKKDIADYYAKNPSQFKQAAAKRVAHILYGPNDKAKAEATLTKLLAGADFATIAKKDSIDKGSAAKGGDLGWPTQPWVAEFQAAVDKLTRIGELSPLVKSQYGWHIIKLLEIRKARIQPLSEVTSDIEKLIKQQRQTDAYTTFLAQIKKKAKIDILDASLKTTTTATTTKTTTPAKK